jgi:hypothetical protein
VSFRYRFAFALDAAQAAADDARRRLAPASRAVREAAARLAESTRTRDASAPRAAGSAWAWTLRVDEDTWHRACVRRADDCARDLRRAIERERERRERYDAARRRVDAFERHRARRRLAFEVLQDRRDECERDEANASRRGIPAA